MVWHALGFHGRHWGPMHWYLGNIWVTCQKCGKSRQIGPEEASRTPAGNIQGNPDDGLAGWRRCNGMIVGGQMKRALREYGLSLGLVVGSFALAMVSLIVSCTPAQQAQVARADAALQQACGALVTVANIAGLVPGVGAFEPYIQAACIATDGLAKLALDPSSIAWLNQMNTNIRALAANAGVRLP